MMTSAQVVETSVNVTSNSPSQDYTHPYGHNLPNYDVTPGFKPFTMMRVGIRFIKVSIIQDDAYNDNKRSLLHVISIISLAKNIEGIYSHMVD